MTWLLLAAALLLFPPTYLVAWRTRRRPTDTLLREHLLDRYAVTLTTGEAFSGLLADVDDRSIVLRDVTVMSANNSPVDGELTLRRESIAYLQRP